MSAFGPFEDYCALVDHVDDTRMTLLNDLGELLKSHAAATIQSYLNNPEVLRYLTEDEKDFLKAYCNSSENPPSSLN